MEQCTEDHPECASRFSNILPTRLLAVSRRADGVYLQLKLSDDLKDAPSTKWVCLSYCWGGSTTLKLTKSTYPTLRDGIAASHLTKTIQDAAYVVLDLGLEFLWVDSLCILRDLGRDWLAEVRTMCDVYRGSFLTLAALGAADSRGGLFASRDPLMYSTCHIPLNDEVVFIHPHWPQDWYVEWPL